jgi:hypothetical protein
MTGKQKFSTKKILWLTKIDSSCFRASSLQTTLCLQFRPNLIASAAIYLAAKVLKSPMKDRCPEPWVQMLAASNDIEGLTIDSFHVFPTKFFLIKKTLSHLN